MRYVPGLYISTKSPSFLLFSIPSPFFSFSPTEYRSTVRLVRAGGAATGRGALQITVSLFEMNIFASNEDVRLEVGL